MKLIVWCLVLFQIVSVSLGLNQEARSSGCDASTVGTQVCLSCRAVGTCTSYVDNNGATQYYVQETQDCSLSNQYCNADSPVCSSALTDVLCLCSSAQSGTCVNDPYGSGQAYLDCRSGGSTSWVLCEPFQVQIGNDCFCTSPTCSSVCKVYIEPGQDGCGSYYDCATGNFVETFCPNGCYSTSTCSCTGQSTCPTCGFEADPNYPSRYIVCSSNPPVSGDCGPGNVFNSSTCTCEKEAVANTCPACGSKPKEGGECYEFVTCVNGTEEEHKCLQSADTCFDEVSCTCEVNCPTCGRRPVEGSRYQYVDCATGVTSTCEPAIFDPYQCTCRSCPTCGWVEDHNNATCNGYFYCGGTGSEFKQTTCPNADYCFDSASCSCLPACPTCGYYADTQDSSKYYQCNLETTEPIPGQCGGGYNFNATACLCG